MNLVPARSLPVSALTALFNAGYTGYLIPLAFDEPALRRHLTDNDIDLDVSRVATDPDPAAFALIGRRGREAWVGGMGTVPERRRRGIGRRTLMAALDAAAGAGAATARLEVLEGNETAIALYENLGFTTTRRVIVAALNELDPPRSEWRPVSVRRCPRMDRHTPAKPGAMAARRRPADQGCGGRPLADRDRARWRRR